ncbi:unnamed protein product [Lepeophtheirus salmonis]|uniref:(salmon louse) hypothetical protein n=1 Tax=Lepeophtheirus salmonis TaxID=72036 RepID=A0A7R8CG97_LEPSM|nr:unnamed protein product [Lepeophtheirus salmonis]CAF2807954.1 unnamed protein product [Lepeophtheirus salmonis]
MDIILSFSRIALWTNSTAFVQNGPKIREVPLVVRRILDESRKPQTIPRAHTLIDKRLIERIEALSSNSSLIQLLETLKYSQVTPQIATLSLTKMSEFKDEYNKEGFASNSTSLIEGLSLGVLELENLMDPLDAISFRRKMFEAALISMTDGVLKPCEIAKTVCIISEYFPDRGAKFRETDKFWPGIMDKSEEINSKNISTVCKALPHLKKSRDIVMKTIEYKLDDCYRDLDTSSALEVLGILTGIETDLTFERTLERYMKAKGVRIKDIELISSICEYAFKFRLRNLTILEGIHSVVRIFGELNYHPPNGFKFFENLENLLDNKFHEFDPMEILNILVGAVYLECSNLSSPEKTEVDNLLRILESGIRVGVKGYERFPIWRSNSYQYVNRNFRVGKAAKKIMGPLGEIVGGLDRLNLDVILSSLPLTPIYIIDLMIYPSAAAKFTRLGKDTKNNMVTAVIIHPSEHYDSKGQHLIGIQAHRIRHLKQMNFKVMELTLFFIRFREEVNTDLTITMGKKDESLLNVTNGAGDNDKESYEEKLKHVSIISKPMASRKLAKKIYKCIKKGMKT